MVRKLLLIITIFYLTPLLCHASKPRTFSLVGQYNYYDDIQNDNNSPSRYIKPDVAVNLDIRVYRIFILILHGGQSIDDDRNFFGLGLKVDLPGFFLMGGNLYQFTRKQKKRSVNTSLYWKTFVIGGVNSGSRLVGNRTGFSVDIFLSRNSFWNLDLGLYSEDGNQFLGLTTGIGYEF